MPQPLLTDWLQTGLQFLTLIGVSAYTWITYRMFQQVQIQNKSISDQLELQRLAQEKERNERDDASQPIFEWLNNYQGAISLSDRTYRNSLLIKGNPIREITLKSHVTSVAKITPSDYLDTGATAKVEILLPLPEAEGRQAFPVEVHYITTTGLKSYATFEIKHPVAPRMLGYTKL